MRSKVMLVAVIAIATLWGCGKTSTPSASQQATVTLKDGSTFSGAVTKNSTEEIALKSDTGETRTYPMSQVASVQYAQDQTASGAPPVGSTPPPAAAAPPVTAPAPVTPRTPAPSAEVRKPAPAPAPERAPEKREPVAEFRTIPSGTTLQVRNNEAIDSQTAEVGQEYTGVVAQDVVDTEGRVAIPRGANAMLIVRSASGQGKLQGRSDLAVDVASVDVGGRTYRLETEDLVQKGKEGVGTNKRTGIFAGGGAALGGIIGAVAGGGKGAAIGALSGAGAGAATQALTRGKSTRIAPETVLSFKLEAPVRIRELR
jgi:hypothetical protein